MKRHFCTPYAIAAIGLIALTLSAGPAVAQGLMQNAATRLLRSYDAETHLGLVANDASENVAAMNTARLNAAMAAMHPAGTFQFSRGSAGPVLLPIEFAAKPFYFKGTLRSGLKSGGALIGTGAGSPHGQGSYFPNGEIGQQTQFIRIDADAASARPSNDFVLLIRNNGFTLKNIYLFGRRLVGNINSGALTVTDASSPAGPNPILVTVATPHPYKTGEKVEVYGVSGNTAANGAWIITKTGSTTFSLNGSAANGAYTAGGRVEGRRTGVGIGVEAREGAGGVGSISSGKTRVEQCGIVDCDVAIKFLPGWYDDSGTLQADVHADDGVWDQLKIFGCPTTIQSENDQAVWHHFRKINVTQTNSRGPTCIIDAPAGGLWKFEMLGVAARECTLLRVRDGPRFQFLPNASRFDIFCYRDGSSALAKPITAATSSNPIVVTSAGHGFATGDRVRVSGVGGNSSVNGTWTITVLSDDTFALNESRGSGNASFSPRSIVRAVQRLTFFEFAGTNPQPYKDWDVRFTGSIATEVDAAAMDQGDVAIFDAGQGPVPSDKIWFDVSNLEKVAPPAGYEWEVVGPWRRLMPK